MVFFAFTGLLVGLFPGVFVAEGVEVWPVGFWPLTDMFVELVEFELELKLELELLELFWATKLGEVAGVFACDMDWTGGWIRVRLELELVLEFELEFELEMGELLEFEEFEKLVETDVLEELDWTELWVELWVELVEDTALGVMPMMGAVGVLMLLASWAVAMFWSACLSDKFVAGNWKKSWKLSKAIIMVKKALKDAKIVKIFLEDLRFKFISLIWVLKSFCCIF